MRVKRNAGITTLTFEWSGIDMAMVRETSALATHCAAISSRLVVLLGFTHIVAGSSELLYGWLMGVTAFCEVALTFFLPDLAGNVLGGTILFSVLSYAQVREEMFKQ
jgi:formate/nitrite transporter FocA (FNT family)